MPPIVIKLDESQSNPRRKFNNSARRRQNRRRYTRAGRRRHDNDGPWCNRIIRRGRARTARACCTRDALCAKYDVCDTCRAVVNLYLRRVGRRNHGQRYARRRGGRGEY